MSGTNYINAAQQRVLKLLGLLCGNEVHGLAPGEIAQALRTSPSNVTRDLANLREAGFAEPLDNGRWRVTPRMGQFALRILSALDDAGRRVEEVRRRFQAGEAHR
ncbi:ArsR family transcriptional regulator [Luteibacter anthropi]|uniref:winged helix-turn-helix domain-containing protein n=1 Tax=Luteibacter anthropi TaxID=564369 RepID=UPI002032202B|nr:ArsR family transcriptional regulator [Luteibacter anthropi]URX63276.1 ArsR family transcriptional regulator [Luteibacter anthropi]